jgi:hypothetical protein
MNVYEVYTQKVIDDKASLLFKEDWTVGFLLVRLFAIHMKN